MRVVSLVSSHLRKVVGGVPVQNHPPDLPEEIKSDSATKMRTRKYWGSWCRCQCWVLVSSEKVGPMLIFKKNIRDGKINNVGGPTNNQHTNITAKNSRSSSGSCAQGQNFMTSNSSSLEHEPELELEQLDRRITRSCQRHAQANTRTHSPERVVGVRPDLGDVERIEAATRCLFELHDLMVVSSNI